MSTSATIAPPGVAGPSGRWLGVASAAVALVIWASWFAVTRRSVTRVLGAYDIAALRLGVGALVLMPAFVQAAPRLSARAWRDGAALSALWGAPFVLLLSLGVQLTSASYAASITPGLMPVFAGLIGWAALGERPVPRRLAGFAVTVAGVVSLGASLGTRGGAAGMVLGTASLLGASALWAGYTVTVRRTGFLPLQAAALVCVLSAAAYLPLYVLLGLSRLGSASWLEVSLQAGYQGVLVSGVAIAAFNRSIALIGPGAAASIVSTVPVVATLLAMAILGEVPGPFTTAAIATIALGALVAARAAAR